MRWDVGPQVMRLVVMLSIRLRYNSLPLITFNYGFNTSLTKPNPCTMFSLNDNVCCQLQHSLAKFLNIQIHYSLSLVLHENAIFCVLGHIWTLKMTINAFGRFFFLQCEHITHDTLCCNKPHLLPLLKCDFPSIQISSHFHSVHLSLALSLSLSLHL